MIVLGAIGFAAFFVFLWDALNFSRRLVLNLPQAGDLRTRVALARYQRDGFGRNLFTGGKACGSRVECSHCRDALGKITAAMVFNELKEILK